MESNGCPIPSHDVRDGSSLERSDLESAPSIAAGLLAWAPAATTGWNQGAAEATLWQLMNGARSNNGMAPVQQHGDARQPGPMAQLRHAGQELLQPHDRRLRLPRLRLLRLQRPELRSGRARTSAGTPASDDSYSPVRVHEQFMASAGHRANVLDPRFTHGGVGAAAADNKMFQGYVQNTRMYTELFMQALRYRAAAPLRRRSRSGAPPSGGAAVAPPRLRPRAAPTPKPKPKPSPGASRRSRRAQSSSAGLDGVMAVVSAPSNGALIRQLRADEVAAARAAALAVTPARRRAARDGDHAPRLRWRSRRRPRRSPACSTASSARSSASSSADPTSRCGRSAG